MPTIMCPPITDAGLRYANALRRWNRTEGGRAETDELEAAERALLQFDRERDRALDLLERAYGLIDDIADIATDASPIQRRAAGLVGPLSDVLRSHGRL